MAIYQHRLDKSSTLAATVATDEVKLAEPAEEEKLMEHDDMMQMTPFEAIKKSVWPYHLTLVLCFTLTLCELASLKTKYSILWLALFPGVVSSYTSVNYDPNSSYYERYFGTIWVFLNFNAFDFIGRYLAGVASQEGSALNIIKKDQVS